MNCKPGDLAIILRVHSDYGPLAGRIIRVTRLSPNYPDCWLTDPQIIHTDGIRIDFADAHLRPIRDSDGEDEMLRIAGRPKETSLLDDLMAGYVPRRSDSEQDA